MHSNRGSRLNRQLQRSLGITRILAYAELSQIALDNNIDVPNESSIVPSKRFGHPEQFTERRRELKDFLEKGTSIGSRQRTNTLRNNDEDWRTDVYFNTSQSTGKVKTGSLWSKSKEDLMKQLTELKTELGQLRIQKISPSSTKLNKIHDLRKAIARVLTVVNLNQRSNLRLFYKNKKYLPLDLRPKQTRAIRRRLSPADAAKKLEKTLKRNIHFPQRKYAIKA